MELISWHRKIVPPLTLLLLLMWTFAGCQTVMAASSANVTEVISNHLSHNLIDINQENQDNNLQQHACCSSGSMVALSGSDPTSRDQKPIWEPSLLWSSILQASLGRIYSVPEYKSGANREFILSLPPVFLSNCALLI
ncbi:hypothetical protein BGP75_16920 [Motiliproteus sp. MSK22-1]|nr:hypothetical protein BGP75_16920 [Motiliproteus sp. MSK22-1]